MRQNLIHWMNTADCLRDMPRAKLLAQTCPFQAKTLHIT